MTLCTDISPDGLKCAADWPNCIGTASCEQNGCFWRRWHSIPADKLRAAPKANQGDLWEAGE